MSNETSAPTITVKQIPEALEICYASKRTPIFISNPGVGKTQSVMTFAASKGAKVRTLVASMLDRTDFQLPMLDKETGSVVFVPLDDLKALSVEHMPDGDPEILYWNEYPCAPESLHPVLYRLINERKIGNLTLRDNVMNIADGNPPSCSTGHDLPFPARRRFRWYHVTVRTDDWMEWAYDNAIHPTVIAFIGAHPSLLSDFDANNIDATTYASPAGYEYLSAAMPGIEKASESLAIATICGDIGQSAGMQFYAFLQHRQKLGDIDELFRTPGNHHLPKERDIQFLLCGIIIDRAASDPDRYMEAACCLAGRLLASNRETGVFLIRSLVRQRGLRDKVRASEPFQKLVRLVCTDPNLEAALFA
jgi:MoxR-like ATPases